MELTGRRWRRLITGRGPSTLAATAMVVVLVAPACSTVHASGQVATETRAVSGFSRIEVAGSGNVTLTQGDAESLSVEADENVLPVVTSEVSDSTLKLGLRSRTTSATGQPIRYRVTVVDLTAVGLTGAAELTAADLEIRTLRVAITGSGRAEISGTVAEQDIQITGSGRYEAADLQSQKVRIQVSGSGQVDVAARDELDVDISGSGKVTYSGNPRIQQSVSGSGQLLRR